VDRNLQEIIDAGEIYGGVWACVSVNAYAYDVKANKGVTFGLNGIQKIKDGESFGTGRPAVSAMFTPAASEDPANYSLDDDIDF
jgi:hypothetical protein